VMCAIAHPAQIVVDVIDAIRNSAGELGIDEVVDIDDPPVTLTTLLPASVLEIAHQFLLLCTDPRYRARRALRKSTS
jgi:hypothetical protein